MHHEEFGDSHRRRHIVLTDHRQIVEQDAVRIIGRRIGKSGKTDICDLIPDSVRNRLGAKQRFAREDTKGDIAVGVFLQFGRERLVADPDRMFRRQIVSGLQRQRRSSARHAERKRQHRCRNPCLFHFMSPFLDVFRWSSVLGRLTRQSR
jgi:hypothetical protein